MNYTKAFQKITVSKTTLLFFLILLVSFLFISCTDDEDDNSDGDDDGDADNLSEYEYDYEYEYQPDGDWEDAPYIKPKKVAVFFEHDDNERYSQGKMYAVAVQTIISHFATEVDIINVDDYKAGDLDSYHAAIFIGSLWDYQLSKTFLDDMYNFERPLMWFHYHIEDYFDSDDYDAKNRFGFDFVDDIPTDLFDKVIYKDQAITREAEDKYFAKIKILDDQKCELLAHFKNGDTEVPYLVKSDNLWFIVNNPFSYMSGETLIFADILHDFLNSDYKEKHRALVRLEDTSNGSAELPKLRFIADKLYEMKVPFVVGVIPTYVDPKGEWYPPGTELDMSDDTEFINTLKYMTQKGGTLIMHGYTHQWDDVSGVDWEFWDEKLDRPIPGDSWDWVTGRLDKGIEQFNKAFGMTPTIWETPHYQASYLDYYAFTDRFKTVFEQVTIYDTLEKLTRSEQEYNPNMSSTTILSPYVMHNSYYGFRIVPENLGYIYIKDGVPQMDDYAVTMDAKGKTKNATEYTVVRDSVVSFFYHHWQPTKELFDTVENLQDLGFEFVNINELVYEGQVGFNDYQELD